jgi:hypothetical protein
VAQRSMKVSENKEFIESDRWKCDKSPSGAHHWIIHSYDMTCKYCSSSKQVLTNRFIWSKPEIK